MARPKPGRGVWLDQLLIAVVQNTFKMVSVWVRMKNRRDVSLLLSTKF